MLVSVGRLVEKKGYDLLLDALARLPEDLNWRFVHIGGGELSEQLQARRSSSGLPTALNGVAPATRRKSSRRCAAPMFSCCQAASPAMATATACPMC